MSYFNWMTWISPDNVNLAAVTGSVGGLGLNPISTWDWNQLTVLGDPLIDPFYSIFNRFLGTLLTAPIILAIWYTNTWNTAYLPINDNHVWDNTGSRYQVSKVVGGNTMFDEAGYKAYSPAYLSASNAFVYGVFFAVYTATITHTFLYHRREIVAGFRNLINRKSAFADSKDIHTRLMRNYREVPERVYLGVLLVSVVLGAVGVGTFPTHTSPAVVLYGGMYHSPPLVVLPLMVPHSIPRRHLLYTLRYHHVHHERRDSLERYCRAFRWSLVHRECFRYELLQGLWLRHDLTNSSLCSRSQARSLRTHRPMGHIQLSNVGNFRLNPRLHGDPQLPNDSDLRRLLAQPEGSLHMPRKQHFLHRFRPLGHPRPHEDVRPWCHLQRSLVVFPNRCYFTYPLLFPSQKVPAFRILPRPNFLGRWTHLGSLQYVQRLVRRPCRLRLQLLHQKAFLRLVVQVQLVSDGIPA